MIALQGHNAHSGKLLNLFRLLAKYNPAAAAYAERLDRAKESGKKLATNYLSRDNAQRLLSVIKGVIVQQVVDGIRVQKKCSIISDGTYDSSKQEATVLLLRYIEIGENDILIPVERVVDVFCCGDTSGVSLCNKIQESLKMIDVDIQWGVKVMMVLVTFEASTKDSKPISKRLIQKQYTSGAMVTALI